jgi:hypothetical protein
MSTTVTCNELEICLLKPILYDRATSVSEQVIRSGLPCGREPRQWRQTTGVSSILVLCQLLLAVLFLAAALVQIAISFAELSRLLERSVIRHLTERVLSESDLKSGYDQVTTPAAVTVRDPEQTAVWSRTTVFPEVSAGHAAAEELRPMRGSLLPAVGCGCDADGFSSL